MARIETHLISVKSADVSTRNDVLYQWLGANYNLEEVWSITWVPNTEEWLILIVK
jgi:hypothetical protein